MKVISAIVLLFSLQLIFSQENKAYTSHEVDTFPQFEGNPCYEGIDAEDCFKDQVIEHVSRVVQYPKKALDNNEEGVVYLQFIVDSTGVVKNIKGRSKNESFKKEAIRTISMLSNLKPATKDGKNVSFVYGVPVHFVLPKPRISQIEYFPQELLVHPNNTDEHENHNEYLHNVVKQKLIALFSQKKSLAAMKKHGKDTINVVLTFQVDSAGTLIRDKLNFNINSRKLVEKFDDGINELASSLPKFKILNRKPENLNSTHILPYRFVVHGKKNLAVTYFPSRDTYTGGIIQEIPIFPGCENLTQKETIQCFQQKMQNHITYHFKYPEEALRTSKSGRVNIMFEISKKGSIENIKAKGPYTILEKEAIRIIKFLPKMKPGRHNGKPAKMPYSIPITFKL